MEAAISWRLKFIDFHNCLHGGLEHRGAGTAIIEVKLAQQLVYLEQEAFYSFFLDLKKAFDSIDREQVILLLEG